jgi:hypothetical protein
MVTPYVGLLAEVSPEAGLGQALLCLLVLGGILVVLCSIVLTTSSVSTTSSRSRKFSSVPDSLDTSTAATEPPAVAKVTRSPRPTKGERRERRASLRRTGNPVDVVVITAKGTEPEKGFVIDRSRGGLCLSISRSVAVGTTLQVRACHAPEALPAIQVLVRHCSEKGERWHVGCQFMERLPWSVLLMFG